VRCLNCRMDELPVATELCPRCGTHLPTLLRDLLQPKATLRGGTFHVQYALGRGGFGVTYRAEHVALDHIVALKEFFPEGAATRDRPSGLLMVSPEKTEMFNRGLTRFVGEGRLLARISHPNVVRVLDLFQDRGTAYLAMELLSGLTLRELLDTMPARRLSADRATTTVEHLVEALETVHGAGICHLDIKPENIIVRPDGQPVLIDFGAARQATSDAMTRSFTLEYAPLELLTGEAVGEQTDLYELGAVIHELLTGERPPQPLERIPVDRWTPGRLAEPWSSLLQQALQVRLTDRPATVQSWWASRRHIASSRPRLGTVPGIRAAVTIPCALCHGELTFGCPTCRGARLLPCSHCRNTGVARCPHCGGRGTQTCPSCAAHGDGDCTSCLGLKAAICATCSGSGQASCPKCLGTLKVPCDRCSGSGKQVCPICSPPA